jgi:hypothetical protein
MGRYKHEGRTAMRRAAARRRADSWRLFEGGGQHLNGAVYLAGYAVECKLKAIAMEAHGVNSISALAEAWKVPDATLLSHDLEAVVSHAHAASLRRV